MPEYKSPKHKLARFFERSRDLWKGKYQDRIYEAKILQNRISYLEENRESWKQRALEAEKQVKELKMERTTSVVEQQTIEKKRK